jgi:hypothetical protein
MAIAFLCDLRKKMCFKAMQWHIVQWYVNFSGDLSEGTKQHGEAQKRIEYFISLFHIICLNLTVAISKHIWKAL